jgi:hypothetical protein
MRSRLECPAIAASMGSGASTGGGLSATGVLGDIFILRLFAGDGSSGETGAIDRAVSLRDDRGQWVAQGTGHCAAAVWVDGVED